MSSIRYGSHLLTAILITGMTSCGAPRPGDDRYMAWVRSYESGMHVRHVQNDLAFDLQFQPAEYAWIKQNGSFDAKAFESQQGDLDQMRYFILNIYSRDGRKDVISQRAHGDVELQKELMYYFSYRFQNDISIQAGSIHRPCSLFHYEQHGTKSFVVGFEQGDEPDDDVTFTINSPVIDTTPVKIKISTDPKVL